MDRKEFRFYVRAASQPQDEPVRHLSEEEMSSFHREQDLSSAERESIREHIASCGKCSQLFKDFCDFIEPARANEPELSELELRRASGTVWNAIKSSALREPPDRQSSWTRIMSGLAAGLILAIGTSGYLAVRLSQSNRLVEKLGSDVEELGQRISYMETTRRTLMELDQQRIARLESDVEDLTHRLTLAKTSRVGPGNGARDGNVPVFLARLSEDRGLGDEQNVKIPPNAPAFELRLLVGNPRDFPEYEVTLKNERGITVSHRRGIKPSGEDLALSIVLRRDGLTSGKYTVQLSVRRGSTSRVLGEYPLRLTFLP